MTKLDDKSIKYIFVRYSDVSKSYKVYNPKERKVMVSKYVVFKEDDYYHYDYIQDKGKNILINLDSSPRPTYMPLR